MRQKLPSWFEHALSWVEAPDLNIQVIRYEDMLVGSVATFTKAAKLWPASGVLLLPVGCCKIP